MSFAEQFFNSIKQVFQTKAHDIIRNQKQKEGQLLDVINIETCLKLKKGEKSKQALFGLGSVKPDYQSQENTEVIIEFKKIGFKQKNNKIRPNEFDIKNGLAQIIEQALCMNKKEAILVIIDGGRAFDKDWDKTENDYTNIFIKNEFVKLSVIRIAIDPSSGKISYCKMYE